MDSDSIGCTVIATGGLILGVAAAAGIWLGIFTVAKKTYDVAIGGAEDRPAELVFAGRISQADKSRWLNERLAILYAQDLEIGRGESNTSDFRHAIEAPTDGVFEISVPNSYGLSTDDLINCQTKEFSFGTAYCWLGDINEDQGAREFVYPSKRLHFSLRILPGDYETLPEEMKERGITGIVDGNIVVVASHPEPKGVLAGLLKIVSSTSGGPSESSIEKIIPDPKPEIVDIPSEDESPTLDNCKGLTEIRQTISQSRTFVRETTLQASLGAKVPIEEVQLELGMQGGYRQKQVESKTYHFELNAGPGMISTYKIHWAEVWQTGTVVVRENNGPVKIPFRKRIDMRGVMANTSRRCN